MSDWIYVVGETSYNQDFLILNQETSEPISLSGTVTMFITKSDFTVPSNVPASGQTMSIVAGETGVARLAVTATLMPDEAGIYLAQIKIEASQTFKTFFLNLRVVGSITT